MSWCDVAIAHRNVIFRHAELFKEITEWICVRRLERLELFFSSDDLLPIFGGNRRLSDVLMAKVIGSNIFILKEAVV